MTQQHRLISYIIITAIVLAIAWFASPSQAYTPRGVFLPSQQHFPTIATEQVTLSGGTAANSTGIPVGTINIRAYAPNNNKKSIVAAEHYAIRLAAQHGANHVVVTLAGFDPSDKTLVLRAKALHR